MDKKEKLKKYHREWHQKTKHKRRNLLRKNQRAYRLRHLDECKQRHKDWYSRNKKKVYDYNKKWRKENIEFYRKRQNEYAKKCRGSIGGEKLRAWAREYFKNKVKTNPGHLFKIKCREKTRTLIKNGVLKKRDFCEICKIKKSKHVHHKNYNNPKDVLFVCVPCHVSFNGMHHKARLHR